MNAYDKARKRVGGVRTGLLQLQELRRIVHVNGLWDKNLEFYLDGIEASLYATRAKDKFLLGEDRW